VNVSLTGAAAEAIRPFRDPRMRAVGFAVFLHGGATPCRKFTTSPPRPDLDGCAVLDHIAAMNGLNQICGICREIIR
jgi:hypothetical protein